MRQQCRLALSIADLPPPIFNSLRYVSTLVHRTAWRLVKKILALSAVLVIALVAFRLMSAAPSHPAVQPDQTAGRLTDAELRAKVDAQIAQAELDKAAAENGGGAAVGATVAAQPNPQLNAKFGSRPLRACPDVTSPPNSAQAAALIQCTMDYETPQQAKLHQEITVQLSSPRKAMNSDGWNRMDSRFPLVDLTASAKVYVCGPVLEAVMHNTGSNCDSYQLQNVTGVCWKTLDGVYRCQINAGMPLYPARSVGPPTTY